MLRKEPFNLRVVGMRHIEGKLPIDTLATIDQEICAHSARFIGNEYSTFSHRIHLSRRFRFGMPTNSTVFWKGSWRMPLELETGTPNRQQLEKE